MSTSGERVVNLDRFLVDTVAYEVTRRFTDVKRTDVREDLWCWYDEHPRLVASLTGHEEYERIVRRELRQRALAYCHHARAAKVGYEFSDLAFYSLGLLRELLPAALYGGSVTPTKDPGSRGVSRPSEGGNLEVSIIDVRCAFESLGVDDAAYIRWVADTGFTEGDEEETNRILRKMQRYLGGPAPAPDPGDVVLEEQEVSEEQIVAFVRKHGVPDDTD